MFKISNILKNPAVNAGFQQVLPPPLRHWQPKEHDSYNSETFR